MTTPTTPQRSNTGAASPREVAQQWALAVSDHDGDRLAALYEVGAPLHLGGEVVLGHENIAAAILSRQAPPDNDATIDAAEHGLVTVRWERGDDDTTQMRIRHGKIVEQWIGSYEATGGRLATIPMDLSTSGELTADDHDLVWDMLDRVVGRGNEQITHVDVRLEQHPDSGRPDPVALRVNVRLVGGSIRAHSRAGDVRGAAHVVERRLTQALHRRAERRSDAHNQRSMADLARDGDGAPPADGYVQRPSSEREIVRHKTVSPGPSTLEEATFDLDSMGYDFFLYIDMESNDDALVARDGDTFAEHRDPPTSSLASARERLDVGHEPFVFFRNRDTTRGNVLYRRVDGHYGLIVPSDASEN